MNNARTVLRGKQLSLSEAAEFFGVKGPTIRSWAEQGCPYLKRGGRGDTWEFDSAAMVDWRLEWLLRRAGVGGEAGNDRSSLTHRKQLAETTIRELEVERKKGEVAPVGWFLGILAICFDKCNARLSSVSSRAAPLVAVETDVAKCQRIIERMIDEARNELVGPTVASLRDAVISDTGVRGAMREVQAYTPPDRQSVGG